VARQLIRYNAVRQADNLDDQLAAATVAARVLLHGRRAVVVIGRAAADSWQMLLLELAGFRYTPS
jgi:hypothetical protein